MRILELFCGTKSVGKVAQKMGHSVISVDIESKFNPTILTDILKWNYKKYPPGHFDFIWASPPCTEFSIAKTNGVRDLDSAIKLVRQTLRIIHHFKPKYFVIENPTGLLRHQKVMKNYAHLLKTVSYCRYNFPYRKNTDLWTNVNFKPKRCIKGTYCKSVKTNGHHLQSVQQGSSFYRNEPIASTTRMTDRYSIPRCLVRDILDAST